MELRVGAEPSPMFKPSHVRDGSQHVISLCRSYSRRASACYQSVCVTAIRGGPQHVHLEDGGERGLHRDGERDRQRRPSHEPRHRADQLSRDRGDHAVLVRRGPRQLRDATAAAQLLDDATH